jgi:UDP-N-acetylmuramate--alanine ligase
LIRDQASQIIGRFRLHLGGDFFREEFENQFWHRYRRYTYFYSSPKIISDCKAPTEFALIRLRLFAYALLCAGVLSTEQRTFNLSPGSLNALWRRLCAARRRTKGAVMTSLPLNIGPIHFIGIGGIGMSGIAEVMLNLGHTVQGSDQKESAITARLRRLGAEIHIGHDAKNLGTAKVVVVSTAIKPNNPERAAAHAAALPIVRRAEMLAELMRLKWNVAVAGTHGKTTTTSLVASLLQAGGIDPTVINGGIIQSFGSNARLGTGDWMVVEADESDGTFLKLPATIAVVTNIDPEHMDHYGDFDALRQAFRIFVENTPFYGAAICCLDHPEVQALIGQVSDRRIVTYGFSPQADMRAINLRYDNGAACFDVAIRSRRASDERTIRDIVLPMPGDHNVLNALASIGVACELSLADEVVREGLASFKGVKRRFTEVGAVNNVRIIDDYGHHPVEISAVLKAARARLGAQGRVIAVHQPHRYSRLNHLFEAFCGCFNEADIVAIAPVFAAGEAPISECDAKALVAGLRARGHRQAQTISGEGALPAFFRKFARPGDLFVCLGAGDITRWANELPTKLSE